MQEADRDLYWSAPHRLDEKNLTKEMIPQNNIHKISYIINQSIATAWVFKEIKLIEIRKKDA